MKKMRGITIYILLLVTVGVLVIILIQSKNNLFINIPAISGTLLFLLQLINKRFPIIFYKIKLQYGKTFNKSIQTKITAKFSYENELIDIDRKDFITKVIESVTKPNNSHSNDSLTHELSKLYFTDEYSADVKIDRWVYRLDFDEKNLYITSNSIPIGLNDFAYFIDTNKSIFNKIQKKLNGESLFELNCKFHNFNPYKDYIITSNKFEEFEYTLSKNNSMLVSSNTIRFNEHDLLDFVDQIKNTLLK